MDIHAFLCLLSRLLCCVKARGWLLEPGHSTRPRERCAAIAASWRLWTLRAAVHGSVRLCSG